MTENDEAVRRDSDRPDMGPFARLQVLAEATRAFAESDIDLDTTLAMIARLIAEAIGDGCSLRLLDDDGIWFSQNVAFHPDPVTQQNVARFFENFPRRSDEGLFGQALRSGEAVHWSAGERTHTDAGSKPEHVPFFECSGARNLLVAPLRARERALGVISVWRDRTTAAFDREDIELLRELAGQAAISVDHARLYREARNAGDQYRTLFDAIPEAAWVFDVGTLRFLAANKTAIQRYGYSLEEFLTMTIGDLRLPEDWPVMNRLISEIPAEGPHSVSIRQVRRDGSIVIADLMSHSMRFDGRAARLVIAEDVTEQRGAEEQLREADARYRMLVDQMPGVVYLQELGDQMGVSYISTAVETMLGYTQEECLRDPQHWMRILHPRDRERVLREHGLAVSARRRLVSEYRNIARDGRVVWVRDELMPIVDADGEVRIWHGIMVDITEQRLAEEALERNERRFESLVQNVSDIVGVVTPEGRLLYVSPAVERILGYPPRERDELTIDSVIHPEEQQVIAELLREMAHKPGSQQRITLRARHANGSWRTLEVRLTNLIPDPSVGGIVMIAHDITERQEFEAQLERQAFYDSLTGLPNRALFLDRLRHAIARAEREPAPFAVLFLDVDNFKVVNDSLGHAVGDDLLLGLARRLESLVRPGDTVARFGGDEFTLLLDELADPAAAEAVAERILGALVEPFELAGRALHTSASIGIVIAGADTDGPDALLRDADIALYRAKARGKSRYAVFDNRMRVQALDRLQLEVDLRMAIGRGELELHYQPIVELSSLAPVGYEALLRWRRPERGLSLPGEFISMAEETGLILPIGEWVLGQASVQVRAWRDVHPKSGRLAVTVNLSARQFGLPNLVEIIASLLVETALPVDWLVLEISETTMMDDIDATVSTLEALKRLGIRLAIDDFGAGYSSLAHLKRFPVDYLKVDHACTTGLGIDARDTMMVSGMISIAHALGLKVVAEGVETEEQHTRLVSLGCDLGQGYYYARPMPAARITMLPPRSPGMQG